MAVESLSVKDKQILESIFSPNLTFGLQYISRESQQTEAVVNGEDKVETENEKKALEFEMLGVKQAEDGDFARALSSLNQAVHCCPDCASVYNNRAQVFLLQGEKDAATSDLEKALELSNYQGKVAGQAFTQRALIHRLNGNNDSALEDFQRAAKLGNSFAKSQMAQLNPYAALCNQMLAQAIGKLREGEDLDLEVDLFLVSSTLTT